MYESSLAGTRTDKNVRRQRRNLRTVQKPINFCKKKLPPDLSGGFFVAKCFESVIINLLTHPEVGVKLERRK